MKTPESFKQKIARSCIYDKMMPKEVSMKNLAEIEEIKMMLVDTNEILSAMGRGFCENCIKFQRNLYLEMESEKMELASKIPQASFHPSTIASQNSFKMLIAAKSIIEPIKPLDNKTNYCKICNEEITTRILFELCDSFSPDAENPSSGIYKILAKDADKTIGKMLVNQANAYNIVIICDKTKLSEDCIFMKYKNI